MHPARTVARRGAARAAAAGVPGALRAPLRGHSSDGVLRRPHARSPAPGTEGRRTRAKGSTGRRSARAAAAVPPHGLPEDRSCAAHEPVVPTTPAKPADQGLPRGRFHPGALDQGRPPATQPAPRQPRRGRTRGGSTPSRSREARPRQPQVDRPEPLGRLPGACPLARPRGSEASSALGRSAPGSPSSRSRRPVQGRPRLPQRGPPRPTVLRRVGGHRQRRSEGAG